jgi:hypothetical protein
VSEPKKRVKKIGGTYQHTGTIVAEFKTTAGESRIVVEFDAPVAGMLHILRLDQVEYIPGQLSERPQDDYRRADILCGHLHARRMHKHECECDNCRHDGIEPCSEKKPCGSCRREFGLAGHLTALTPRGDRQ